jgi:hypothetical protein
VIDVGCARRPAVIKAIDVLHAEPAGDLFFRQHAPAKIFEFNLFEANFAGTSHIERHRSVTRDVLVCLAIGGTALRPIVDPDAENVGVQNYFKRIPLVRLVRVVGTAAPRQ